MGARNAMRAAEVCRWRAQFVTVPARAPEETES